MSKFFGKRNTAAIAALVVAAVAGVGAYAFTASNTVPAEYAGAGAATVGHYTVTNVELHVRRRHDDGDRHDVRPRPAGRTTSGRRPRRRHRGTPAAADYKDCGAAAGTSAPYVVTCTGLTFAATARTQKLYIAAVTLRLGHTQLGTTHFRSRPGPVVPRPGSTRQNHSHADPSNRSATHRP